MSRARLIAIEMAKGHGRLTLMMATPDGERGTRRIVRQDMLRNDERPYAVAAVRQAGLDPNSPEGRAMRRNAPYWIFDFLPSGRMGLGYGYQPDTFNAFMDEIAAQIRRTMA